MNRLKLGELCAGYGGLGMAVEDVFNADTAWFSEFDAAPSKILAHHWPHVPNYGDMTKIDWAAIEPVDIISGGTPCQDLSAAGARRGMTEGTRSNLWVQMREAVAIQRPRYVVWENVRGAFSAEASSSVEQCPGCVGDTAGGRVFLRALGRVLGDLSDLGYDTQWRGLRASDVGAPHARFRVFVLAQDTNLAARSERRQSAPGQAEGGRAWANLGGRSGAPVADTDDPGRGEQRRTIAVQPEHAAAEYEGAYAPDAHCSTCGRGADAGDAGRWPSAVQDIADAEGIGWGERWAQSTWLKRGLAAASNSSPAADTGNAARDRQWARQELGEGDQEVADAEGYQGWQFDGDDQPIAWGDYAPAIERWESVMGRRSPSPTEPTGRAGGQRLSPRFTEWMMGLQDGWVTDPAIGISRNEQLKACGNGVVPQQAVAALQDMLAAFQTVEVAA